MDSYGGYYQQRISYIATGEEVSIVPYLLDHITIGFDRNK